MKKFFAIAILIGCYGVITAQEVINPFAKMNTDLPELTEYAKSHDMTQMDGDTITFNMFYAKQPYSRPDETWGYIDGDVYVTYTDIVFNGNEELDRKPLYYYRDYQNKKPTRFALHTQEEMEKTMKSAKTDGEAHYFFRAEKFIVKVIPKDGITNVIFKRVHIPKYFTVEIK